MVIRGRAFLRAVFRAVGLLAVCLLFLYAVYSVLQKREINELIRNDVFFFITLNKFTRRCLLTGRTSTVS